MELWAKEPGRKNRDSWNLTWRVSPCQTNISEKKLVGWKMIFSLVKPGPFLGDLRSFSRVFVTSFSSIYPISTPSFGSTHLTDLVAKIWHPLEFSPWESSLDWTSRTKINTKPTLNPPILVVCYSFDTIFLPKDPSQHQPTKDSKDQGTIEFPILPFCGDGCLDLIHGTWKNGWLAVGVTWTL